MKTLAFRSRSDREPPYLVLVHNALAPDPEEWSAYVSEFAKLMAAGKGPVHAFVSTDGGSPDAAQRKQLADVVNTGEALTHVFTTDAVIRGVVTAFRWLARARAVAHQPKEFPTVCIECGVSPFEVMKDFNDLRRSIPNVQMVSRIADSMNPPPRQLNL